MKIILKDNKNRGLMRTVHGYIHLEVSVGEGRYELPEQYKVANFDAVNYSGHNIQVQTAFDHLVINDADGGHHVMVTTHNNGDPVGAAGWRHIAHHILSTLEHDDQAIRDATLSKDMKKFHDHIAANVVDMIRKLVVTEPAANQEVEVPMGVEMGLAA